MSYKEMFELQAKLDERINREKGLSGEDVINERLLALLVEVGEFANETRCFKFWSEKAPSEKTVQLEEYADILHFILSVGNHSGLLQSDIGTFKNNTGQSLTEMFIDLYRAVTRFQDRPSSFQYENIWRYFILIGNELGFSSQDVYRAYMDKNKENHSRQDTGY